MFPHSHLAILYGEGGVREHRLPLELLRGCLCHLLKYGRAIKLGHQGLIFGKHKQQSVS